MVLPTWVYDGRRRELAATAFESLAKTMRPSEPALLLVVRKSSIFEEPTLPQGDFGETVCVDEPPEVGGTEQTLAWGTQYIFDNWPEVTHAVWLGDDALFNPRWLIELEALIGRHPDARAHSVYRSAYEQIHKTLIETESDAMVRSLCGHGLTFTREEWRAWGIDWRHGKIWSCPTGGETLDLYHSWARPGERWVTRQSYVQHTGLWGVHCRPGIPEHAQNFSQ